MCLDIRRHSIDTWRAGWTHRSLNLRFPPPILFPTCVRPPTGPLWSRGLPFLFDMTVGVSDKSTPHLVWCVRGGRVLILDDFVT